MDTRRRQGNGQTNKAHHRRRITRRRFFVKQSSKFTQEQNHLQIITKKTLFHYSRISTMFSQLVILLAIFILNFCRNHVPGKKNHTKRYLHAKKVYLRFWQKYIQLHMREKHQNPPIWIFTGKKNSFSIGKYWIFVPKTVEIAPQDFNLIFSSFCIANFANIWIFQPKMTKNVTLVANVLA